MQLVKPTNSEIKQVATARYFLDSRYKPVVETIIKGIRNYRDLGEHGFFGVFLYGAPGVGKTSMVDYLAEQTGGDRLKVPLFANPDEVREAYKQARAYVKEKNRPVLISINEIDALGKRSSGTTSENKAAILAALLTESESTENTGVFTFYTSNRFKEDCDEAFMRAPRGGIQVEIFPPTLIGREKVMQALLSDKTLPVKWEADNIKHAASISYAYTPADLLGLIQLSVMETSKAEHYKDGAQLFISKSMQEVLERLKREKGLEVAPDVADKIAKQEGDFSKDKSDFTLFGKRNAGKSEEAPVSYFIRKKSESEFLVFEKKMTNGIIDAAFKFAHPSAIASMPFIEPKERLKDVAGGYIEQQKKVLQSMGLRIDNGANVILYGPPGSGKTFIALALGGELGYNTIIVNPSNIIDKYVGESGKKVAQLFTAAKALAPCLLIIDEGDGLDRQNPYSEGWMSVLKANTSEKIPGVMVIMTGNDPSYWGDDILSRFTKLYIPRPDNKSLSEIIANYTPAGCSINPDMVIEAGGDRITPRLIKDAIATFTNFGKTPTTERLIQMISTTQMAADTRDYESIRKLVGDDTARIAQVLGYSD